MKRETEKKLMKINKWLYTVFFLGVGTACAIILIGWYILGFIDCII